MRSREYIAYMNSPEWKSVRQKAFVAHGRKCQCCGATKNLEVHHRHYDTLGHERVEDLEVLCVACHDEAHEEREDERREKAINTYATKKYGEDWADWKDYEVVAEEFDEWIDSRPW